MPYLGTAAKMNPMRKNRLRIPIRNVSPVFPSPFKTLVKVVFKYKNGQSQERIVI